MKFGELKKCIESFDDLSLLKSIVEKLRLPTDTPISNEFISIVSSLCRTKKQFQLVKILSNISEEPSYHQYIMNAAYNLYKNNDWTYDLFIKSISKELRIAVLTGVFRTESDQLMKWLKNGYVCYESDLIHVILSISKIVPEFKNELNSVSDIISKSFLLYRKLDLIEKVSFLVGELKKTNIANIDNTYRSVEFIQMMIEKEIAESELDSKTKCRISDLVNGTFGDPNTKLELESSKLSHNLEDLNNQYNKIKNSFLIACELYFRRIIKTKIKEGEIKC